MEGNRKDWQKFKESGISEAKNSPLAPQEEEVRPQIEVYEDLFKEARVRLKSVQKGEQMEKCMDSSIP